MFWCCWFVCVMFLYVLLCVFVFGLVVLDWWVVVVCLVCGVSVYVLGVVFFGRGVFCDWFFSCVFEGCWVLFVMVCLVVVVVESGLLVCSLFFFVIYVL